MTKYTVSVFLLLQYTDANGVAREACQGRKKRASAWHGSNTAYTQRGMVFVLPRKYFNEIYLGRSPWGTRAANSGGLSCTMAAAGLEWATNGHNQATAAVMKRPLPLSYRDYGNFLFNLPFVHRLYLGGIRLSLLGIRISR